MSGGPGAAGRRVRKFRDLHHLSQMPPDAAEFVRIAEFAPIAEFAWTEEFARVAEFA